MPSRSTFRLAPPQQVYDSYKAIRNSDLILSKTLDEKNIEELQNHLNSSQPQSDEENMTRSLIQYLYRKNPTNFCRFLVRSRLSHLILWTEAKCIVQHFGLRGVVYVKWNDQEYECSLHRNVNHNTQGDMEHPSVQRTYDNVGRDYDGGRDRSNYYGRGGGDIEGGGRTERYDNRSRGRGGRDIEGGGRTERYDNRSRGGGRGRSGRSNYNGDRDRGGGDRNYTSRRTNHTYEGRSETNARQYNQECDVDFPTLPVQTRQNTPNTSPRMPVHVSDDDSDDSIDSDVDTVATYLAGSLVLPTSSTTTTTTGVSYSSALKGSDPTPAVSVE